jgi:hypothetical protein
MQHKRLIQNLLHQVFKQIKSTRQLIKPAVRNTNALTMNVKKITLQHVVTHNYLKPL